MNCAEFDAELNQVLDCRGLLDVATLQGHAGECSACRVTLEQARGLMEAIDVWRGAVPEVDFADAVVLACAGETPAGKTAGKRVEPLVSLPERNPDLTSQGRRRLAATYAMLAALSSMFLVGMLLMTGSPVSPTIVETRPTVDGQDPVVSPPAEPELALLHQAGDAYGRLAKSAAGALEEFAVIVIPGAGGAAPSARTSDSAEGPLLEGLQQQLQPVGRSLGNALDFLWEVGAPPADSRT